MVGFPPSNVSARTGVAAARIACEPGWSAASSFDREDLELNELTVLISDVIGRRIRTRVTKKLGSGAAGLAMAVTLLEAEQDR